MAKNTDKSSNEENTFNAVAKQFIKYGGSHLKPGDKFKVKESDAKELNNYAEIEIPKTEEVKNNQDINGENGQQGEKAGGQ